MAETEESNIASRKVLEKAGFKATGATGEEGPLYIRRKWSMETDRILLRRWRESDADALFKFASDPSVGPRAGWPPSRRL